MKGQRVVNMRDSGIKKRGREETDKAKKENMMERNNKDREKNDAWLGWHKEGWYFEETNRGWEIEGKKFWLKS